MDIQIFYCKACGIEYQHQCSGEGCFEEKSSRDYCSHCHTAIKPLINDIEELKTKLKKFENEVPELGYQDWVEVNDSKFDFDTIFSWMSNDDMVEHTKVTFKNIGLDKPPLKMLECKKPYFNVGTDMTFRIGVPQVGTPIVEAWGYFENGKFKHYLKKIW